MEAIGLSQSTQVLMLVSLSWWTRSSVKKGRMPVNTIIGKTPLLHMGFLSNDGILTQAQK